MKVLISNVGFGSSNINALNLLKTIPQISEIRENLSENKFTLIDFLENNVQSTDILIAGTETIDSTVLDLAKNLKLIARVGVGVDNLDLSRISKRKIKICYTPDAPSVSVPEFTLSLMLNLIKGISISDRALHNQKWIRPMGKSLSDCHIGIVGVGRIGSNLIQKLLALEPTLKISFYDPSRKEISGAHYIEFEEIFEVCDLISVHIPLTTSTHSLISHKQFSRMKMGSFFVNTSRGALVDEIALFEALKKNIAGAAIDVYNVEPYSGILCTVDNCLLTAHIASMNRQVRSLMEREVIEDVINFVNNRPLIRPYRLDQV